MNYINLTTREIKTRTLMKYTGLRLDDLDVVHQAGWTPITEDKPEYDPDTQYLTPGELTIDGFDAVQHYDVVDYTPEELADRQKRAEMAAGATEYLSTANSLTNIDSASIRPLRAILTAQAAGNTPDPADMEKINTLEQQATEARQKLSDITDFFKAEDDTEDIDGSGADVISRMRTLANSTVNQ